MNNNISIEFSTKTWENIPFCDKRLKNRAIKIANSFYKNPFSSPPKMFNSWKELKGFYRFLDSDSINHDNLIKNHCENTKEVIQECKVILAIQDATTIIIKKKEEIKGFYPVGASNGLIVQNTIAVDPNQNSPKIIGLLDQHIHHRKQKNERTQEDRESFLWFKGIHALKKQKFQIIDVMDRGADAAIVMHESKKYEHDFIVRAKQVRSLSDDNFKHLIDFSRQLKPTGRIKTKVRKNNKNSLLEFNISFSKVNLPPPKYNKDIGITHCNLVFVEETIDSKEPISWLLLTSLDVNNFKDAIQVVEYYKQRWIIEEYHKCMKTGFKLEETQLRTLKRLEALLAFVSISAIKLLEIRDLAKNKSKENAVKYIDKEDINIIKAYFKIEDKEINISQFLIYIARMGGFLARKSDGNPGWITIWRGFKEFIKIKEGYELYKEMSTCG